ncbi:MAG: AraC family transcriptional regulator [Polyangiaceae bacterium]|nr:AraC family transcriptional regulator [Polyangiaceae bacterium]
MIVKRFQPSAALANVVRAFEIVESRDGMTRTLLPETGLVLGVRYAGAAALVEHDGPHKMPDYVLSGLRSSTRRMQTLPGSGIVLTKFREGGAASFFQAPLHEIFEGALPLDSCLRASDVERVAERVAEAKSDEGRIVVLEEMLLGMLRAPADVLVQAAVRAIEADPASIRIAQLAGELGLSQDALEKRFRRAVGASPKKFASIVRFKRATDAYKPAMSLSQLSHEHGFSDQSHFIREFRSVTGHNPTRFFSDVEYC